MGGTDRTLVGTREAWMQCVSATSDTCILLEKVDSERQLPQYGTKANAPKLGHKS